MRIIERDRWQTQPAYTANKLQHQTWPFKLTRALSLIATNVVPQVSILIKLNQSSCRMSSSLSSSCCLQSHRPLMLRWYVALILSSIEKTWEIFLLLFFFLQTIITLNISNTRERESAREKESERESEQIRVVSNCSSTKKQKLLCCLC